MIVVSRHYKRCSRCRVFKRVSRDPAKSDFYRKRKRDAALNSQCKTCCLARLHEWDANHPDVKKARQRNWLRDQRMDRERHAELKDQARTYWRRRRGITPDRYRESRSHFASSPGLPREPFAVYLDERVERIGVDATIAETGMGEKTLKDIRQRRRLTVTLDIVDRALLHSDVSLDDLYAEVAA